MKPFVFGLAAAFLATAACQPGAEDAAETASLPKPVLTYENAYVMAPLGGRDVTVGGIDISVEGSDVTLTGATSPIAEAIETHTMSVEDNTMKMRHVEGLEIKDGETLVLESGSDHLMLFGLSDGLAAGQTATITFYFDVPGLEEPVTMDAEAEIRAQGA